MIEEHSMSVFCEDIVLPNVGYNEYTGIEHSGRVLDENAIDELKGMICDHFISELKASLDYGFENVPASIRCKSYGRVISSIRLELEAIKDVEGSYDVIRPFITIDTFESADDEKLRLDAEAKLKAITDSSEFKEYLRLREIYGKIH